MGIDKGYILGNRVGDYLGLKWASLLLPASRDEGKSNNRNLQNVHKFTD